MAAVRRAEPPSAAGSLSADAPVAPETAGGIGIAGTMGRALSIACGIELVTSGSFAASGIVVVGGGFVKDGVVMTLTACEFSAGTSVGAVADFFSAPIEPVVARSSTFALPEFERCADLVLASRDMPKS